MSEKKYDDRILFLQALGIMFVVLGHTGDPVPILSNWFPYSSFHMPLFSFLSGYLYNSRNESGICKFIMHKFKRLILPFYIWLLIYGSIGNILIDRGWVLYGQKMNLENFFIYPWSFGCKYSFTAAWWFVPALFLLHILVVLVRKILCINNKKIKEMILLVVSILLACLSINYCRKTGGKYGGVMPSQFMILLEILFLFPFYEMGYVFKLRIGKVIDELSASVIYPVIIFLQSILIIFFSKNGSLVSYSVVHLIFEGNCFVTLIETVLGIVFWWRISGELFPIVNKYKGILNVGKSTWSILLHHEFLIFTFQCVLLFIQTFIGFVDIDKDKLLNNYWYTFSLRGIQQFNVVYVIISLYGGVMISSVVYKIKTILHFEEDKQ